MHKMLTPVALASLLLIACGGGGDDGVTAVIRSSLVEDCRGAVSCALVDGSSKAGILQLERAGDSCIVGDTELRADGTVPSEIGPMKWTSSATEFRVCYEAVCVACEALGAAPASGTAPKAGTCTGSASSCSMRSAGSCSGGGCSFDSHYHPSMSGGYFTSECEGYADSCDSFDDETSCEGQRGCRWE